MLNHLSDYHFHNAVYSCTYFNDVIKVGANTIDPLTIATMRCITKT